MTHATRRYVLILGLAAVGGFGGEIGPTLHGGLVATRGSSRRSTSDNGSAMPVWPDAPPSGQGAPGAGVTPESGRERRASVLRLESGRGAGRARPGTSAGP